MSLTFTIITCTYNASQYIERTLNSVFNQTYAHIEHLIIDGASKDDTVEKARLYEDRQAKEHPSRSIIIKSESDKGLYDAMNKGIQHASGNYILFLNAGDIFASTSTLADIAKQMEGKDTLPGVIYGDTDIMDEQGNHLGKRRLSPPENLNWRSFRHGMLVCHQAFYALTDIAKTTPYNLKYRLSADVDWCIRIMKEANNRNIPLHNTHLTLCSYLEGGMSVKNHRASLRERFNIMCEHYGTISTILMHIWFVVRNVIKRKR